MGQSHWGEISPIKGVMDPTYSYPSSSSSLYIWNQGSIGKPDIDIVVTGTRQLDGSTKNI